jgi:predicted dehydrogenase
MVGVLGAKKEAAGMTLLWGTANLFSQRRFMSGASTNPNSDVFALGGLQVKEAMDASARALLMAEEMIQDDQLEQLKAARHSGLGNPFEKDQMYGKMTRDRRGTRGDPQCGQPPRIRPAGASGKPVKYLPVGPEIRPRTERNFAMKKVSWGVLSTAKIGREKVIPALQQSQFCSVDAIASRDLSNAQSVAASLGIGQAYGSYEALLEDPSIEAIYNPLPNDLHVPLTLAAARAGKHVLCEKPFALNANEAAALREVAGQVHIMEAFMVRFHPQWLKAREMVRNGSLGELRTVQALFSYFNVQQDNIRNRVEAGGGALYDIGCYPIVAGRFMFEAEPVRVMALVDRDPDFQTDRTVSAVLDFGDSRRLESTQSAPYQRLHLVGTRQRLEIEIPFNAPANGTTRFFTDDGALPGAASAVVHTLPPCDQYTLQGDAFSQAIRGELPLPYGLDDAIQNMHIIDALFRSEQSGAWEVPGRA